jgi:hypothetical protein
VSWGAQTPTGPLAYLDCMPHRRILASLLLCVITGQLLVGAPAEAKPSKSKKAPATSAAVAKGCRILSGAAKQRDTSLERIAQTSPPPPFGPVYVMGAYYLDVAIHARVQLKNVITVEFATQLRLVIQYFNDLVAIINAMNPDDPGPTVQAMDAALTSRGGEEVIVGAMNDVATFIEKICGAGTA